MKRRIFMIFSLAIVVGVLFNIKYGSSASALTLSSGRDCDDNAVMRCGALTSAELQQKYRGTGVIGIFNRFGISANDINSSGTPAVAGEVTRDGNVFVNDNSACGGGRLVATNAITAGRQNMAGSTKVMAGGVAFYERPPSVSFASSPLATFVFMKNCRFSAGIIASCGNPVRATPVVRTTPSPTQAPQPSPPPAPTPTPPPAPPPQVKSVTTPPPAPQQITNAGPGDVVGLGILTAIGGGVAHYIYQRRRFNN